MRKIISLIAVLSLIGAGCINVIDTDEVTDNQLPYGLSDEQLACEETGGLWYNEDSCGCPEEDLFDPESGECQTADGSPDGERGEQFRNRLNRAAACNESGGAFDLDEESCDCPKNDGFDAEAGACIDEEEDDGQDDVDELENEGVNSNEDQDSSNQNDD